MTDLRHDIDERVRAERTRLLSVLEPLDAQRWATPSLCAGWTVRDLVVHLLMPYELSVPRFLLLMLRARFAFDRAADRWARRDRRFPAEVVRGCATPSTAPSRPGPEHRRRPRRATW